MKAIEVQELKGEIPTSIRLKANSSFRKSSTRSLQLREGMLCNKRERYNASLFNTKHYSTHTKRTKKRSSQSSLLLSTLRLPLLLLCLFPRFPLFLSLLLRSLFGTTINFFSLSFLLLLGSFSCCLLFGSLSIFDDFFDGVFGRGSSGNWDDRCWLRLGRDLSGSRRRG